MILDALHLSGFFVHTDTRLSFPRTGLVLISGPNGSGKSLLLEGLSVCLWGKGLRGPSPWPSGGNTGLRVAVAGLEVSRSYRDGRASVTLHDPLDGDREALTATKAQPEIDRVVGAWEVWRRTDVLSSSDAAHFGQATDGERKRLLELLLGLERFDRASARARESHVQAQTELHQAVLLAEQRRTALRTMAERLADMRTSLAMESPPEPPKPSADKDTLTAGIARTRALLESAQEHLYRMRNTAREAEAAYAQLCRCLAAEQNAQLDTACRLCGTVLVTGEALARAGVLHEERLTELAASVERARTLRDAAAAQAEDPEHRTAIDNLRALLAELVAAHTQACQHEVWQSAANLRASHTASIEQRIRELQARQTELQASDLEAALVPLKAAVAVKAEAIKVLGLQGVRARLFDGVLEAVESSANTWLARLDGSLYCEIRPVSEKSAGGVRDAISLRVSARDGGLRPYLACSGGQRRRVDLAVLMALADVASAVHGVSRQGTLWLDEATDALDSDAIVRFGELARELGRERAVCVISHRPDLVEAIDPVRHFKIHNGRVTA